MKLEDIKPPKGFTIRGYQMPADGEYILCSDNVARRVTVDDFAYHCAAIVLDPVWEPEIGKYYEFSDLADFTCSTTLGLYVGSEIDVCGRVKYFTDKDVGWYHIRPIKGELGK